MVSEVMQTYRFYPQNMEEMIYGLVTANEIHMLEEIMNRNVCSTQAVVVQVIRIALLLKSRAVL